MRNQKIVQILERIADRYRFANDRPRSRAFYNAARNVELLELEINSENIDNINFSTLGESTIEVIHEFAKTGTSLRLEKLQEEYPPKCALSLLELYDFDRQYIQYLWKKYRASTIPEIWKIREGEERVDAALKQLERLSTDFYKFTPFNFPVIGDCGVQTAFGAGKESLQEMVIHLKHRDHKHIFIADYFSGDNVFGGLTLSRMKTQRESIKNAQMEFNLRIWQGLILDVDLEGNVLAPAESVSLVEFVVIRLSTSPHTYVLERLHKAVRTIRNQFSNKPIVLDCLNKYSHVCFESDVLMNIINNEDLILNLNVSDYISASRIVDFLQDKNFTKVMLSTSATCEEDLDNLNLLQDVAYRLGITENTLINCLPSPFRTASSFETSAGERQSTTTEPQNTQGLRNKEETIKRLEETINKFQKLQHSRQRPQKEKK